MSIAVFQSVPTVVRGEGALQHIVRVLPSGLNHVLIVTGCSAMQRHGQLAATRELLTGAGLHVHTFESVPPEPPLAAVDAAREAALSAGVEWVIGLGGGSALDVAKAAAVLIREDRPTREFFNGFPLAGNGIPHLLIPTTFGTGTEVTPNAVLTDSGAGMKKSIRHDTLRPAVAIVDPRLGLSAPASVKAESGLDALTQAIEGYSSLYADDLSEPLSLRAVELLLAGLPSFVEEPGNVAAAGACATGSLLAAQAFSNCRLGVIHGVVHPLGALTHQPHGRLCGFFLPHALRYNRCALGKKYDVLCALAGGDIAEVCQALLERFGVEPAPAGMTLDVVSLAKVVKDAMPSGSLKANPRPVSEEELEELVRKVFRVKDRE